MKKLNALLYLSFSLEYERIFPIISLDVVNLPKSNSSCVYSAETAAVAPMNWKASQMLGTKLLQQK